MCFFHDDLDLAKEYIGKAEVELAKGAEWERRNKLKARGAAVFSWSFRTLHAPGVQAGFASYTMLNTSPDAYCITRNNE